MGDLTDTIFQRPCSLADSKDRDRSRSKHDAGVTVLEAEAQETVGEIHPLNHMRFARGGN